jgi:peptidoglycan/LPS O-acetylase OafA/YrhL
MHRGQSLYLDLLRLAAALEVFVYHLAGLPNTGMPSGPWTDFGHEAVTIFFVLSGFVIPYAARSREPDPSGFVVARLTRIYSVALPCLLLTLLFDWVGHRFDPAIYQGLSPAGSPTLRIGIGAAMLNESWQSIQMLSNTPYWSIAYEFWYYAIFAAMFFLRGWFRIAGTLAVAFIAGPNIILLFPIWAAGWIAFSERATGKWPRWLIWLAFIQPVFVFAAYHHFEFQRVGGAWLESGLGHDIWWTQMAWSRYLLTDTLLGFSVALNLAAAKHLGPVLERVIGKVGRPIRWGVARSFTLYLLHQPAILVVTALLATALRVETRSLVIGAITFTIVIVVAQLTELQRGRLKPLVQWVIDMISVAWTVIFQKRKPTHARG